MKFHVQFFLKRKGLSLDSFLKNVSNLGEAVLLFEENNLYGYDLNQVSAILSSRHSKFTELHDNQNTSDDDTTCEVPRKNAPEAAKKTRRKKPVTRKPADKKSAARKSTPRKSTTRRTRKKAVDKKDTPEDKGDEKKDDSSYFKTWKVPYVEPE